LSVDKVDPAAARGLEPRQCPARGQSTRHRIRSNVAQGSAYKVSALQSPVVEAREQREQLRHHVFRVRRRGSKSMVANQCGDQLRSQIPPKVGKDKFRYRVTSADLSFSGSARRRLWVGLNTNSCAEVHRLNFISRSRRRLVESMRMKRAPNRKECRALTL